MTHEQCFFSIVIPLYNKEDYIELTINSILNQSIDDYEIIVVDDGSKDKGVDIVGSIKDTRIRVYQQANAGVAAARNFGITKANGEWICFLDADDWQHPEYLAHQMATIKTYPDFNVVATNFRPIKDTPDWHPAPWQIEKADFELINDLPKRWMRSIPFFTGSIAVRKRLLDKMQPCFPVGESYGEDLDLWFRIAEENTIVLFKQPLVAYRTALSGSLANLHRDVLITPFLARLKARAVSRPSSDNRQKSTLLYIHHQYITQARLYAAKNQRRTALKQLWEIWPEGIKIKRWWTTLIMTLLVPNKWIDAWQTWRKKRTAC